jgi:quinone-modifying oxidoreductase subunit QmoA
VIVDSSNFIEGSRDQGMFGAGAAASPLDVNRAVQSATAASLRAIQVIRKTASTEAV